MAHKIIIEFDTDTQAMRVMEKDPIGERLTFGSVNFRGAVHMVVDEHGVTVTDGTHHPRRFPIGVQEPSDAPEDNPFIQMSQELGRRFQDQLDSVTYRNLYMSQYVPESLWESEPSNLPVARRMSGNLKIGTTNIPVKGTLEFKGDDEIEPPTEDDMPF